MYLQLFQPSFTSIYQKIDWLLTKYPPWYTYKDLLVLIKKKLEFLLFYQMKAKNLSFDPQRAKKILNYFFSPNNKDVCNRGLKINKFRKF